MKRAYIEISNACNLRCSFCPSPGIAGQRQWMTQELFETTLDQLQGRVEEVYLHVLGEPLLHPKLETFLAACTDRNLKVNITTNGLLIGSYSGMLLAAPALRQVNFSIHSLYELAGNASPALDAILNFAKLAMEQRPDLFINLRLWNEDPLREPDLQKWNATVAQQIADTLCGPDAILPPFQPGRNRQLLAGRTSINMDSKFQWPADTMNESSSARGTCQALKTHCAILADGRVVACCLDYQGDLELGHVLEGGIDAALASPRARAMRNGFDRRTLVEPFCQSCTFCRRFG
jgi:sulfatase maturation enzyme AslB (radical SAM superfamily)